MTYAKGDTIRLFSSDASDQELTVKAPSGIKTTYPPSRSVRFLAADLGQWSYSWSNGDTGEFTVEPPVDVIELIEEIPAEQIAPGAPLRTSST